MNSETKMRILSVQLESLVLKEIAETLRSLGHDWVNVESQASANDLLKTRSFDFLISSADDLSKLRKQYPEMISIVLPSSGNLDSKLRTFYRFFSSIDSLEQEKDQSRLRTLAAMEREEIKRVLSIEPNLERAARILGIATVTLWRKRKEHEIL